MNHSSFRPKIHGHRGARGLLPENSLIAIEKAIELGCNGVEMDLCVSKENKLIVHHDPIFSDQLVRERSGAWVARPIRIRDLSVDEIKLFDVGRIKPETAYHARFSSQQSVDGTGIPTLEEVVSLVKGQGEAITLNLELKSTPDDQKSMPCVDDYIDAVVSEIRSLQIEKKTFLQSFAASSKQFP